MIWLGLLLFQTNHLIKLFFPESVESNKINQFFLASISSFTEKWSWSKLLLFFIIVFWECISLLDTPSFSSKIEKKVNNINGIHLKGLIKIIC